MPSVSDERATNLRDKFLKSNQGRVEKESDKSLIPSEGQRGFSIVILSVQLDAFFRRYWNFKK